MCYEYETKIRLGYKDLDDILEKVLRLPKDKGKIFENFAGRTDCVSGRSLGIFTGKKHPKIKIQCLRKIRICAFGSMVHHINSLRGSKTGTNFPKK